MNNYQFYALLIVLCGIGYEISEKPAWLFSMIVFMIPCVISLGDNK